MTRKLKFKPIITRVKLNPEQAVLTCTCHKGTRIIDEIDCAQAGYGPYGCTWQTKSFGHSNAPCSNDLGGMGSYNANTISAASS